MKKDKFVKMKVWFDEATYKEDLADADRKIKLLEEASQWCAKHIDISKMDKNKFVFDMTKEFSRCLKDQKGDAVKIEISIEKLMFLLDINISELVSMQSAISKSMGKALVIDNEFVCKVDKENYQAYTKSQEENDKLIAGNNLAKALELASKYVKIYPLSIQQATSGFLQYRLNSNSYAIRLHQL